ncbi:MAG: hypothetical protein JWQ07_3082 [Ramlibacter sp.]|nr:hypothetical protein [Ramlibacter sp.]
MSLPVSDDERTWDGWRWAYMILGLGCAIAAAWLAFHWAGTNQWMLAFPIGFAVVLCGIALRASDSALKRIVETD